MKELRIAMLGTRGVPARYGGFETAVEEIGRRLVQRGHHVRVYCRTGNSDVTEHLGMQLVHLPALHVKQAETLSHTALSVRDMRAREVDVAIVFNAANAPLLPALRRRGIPTAVHVDGIESRRVKWGTLGRRYYAVCERLAVRWADELIADARGIEAHYQGRYGAPSTFIPYGAPIKRLLGHDRLGELDLRPDGYHLVVARFEPENNVHLAVAGYRSSRSRLPLVVVGSAPYADAYRRRVEAAAGAADVRLVGPIWDQQLLDQLYAGCASYIHGHSVGGTNPSLLRAMGAGAPVIAIDVVFTREVLGPTGAFFTDGSDVAELLAQIEDDPVAARERGRAGQQRAAERYDWDAVTDSYEALCVRLSGTVRSAASVEPPVFAHHAGPEREPLPTRSDP